MQETDLEPVLVEELPDWLQELRTGPELAEVVASTQEPGEAAPLDEGPPEPVPEEELPDWLRQLRPTEEERPAPLEGPLPARAMESLEPHPEELGEAVSLVAGKVEEPMPPVTDGLEAAMPLVTEEPEDLEWLDELEQATPQESVVADRELAVPLSPPDIPETQPPTEQAVVVPVEASLGDIPAPQPESAPVELGAREQGPAAEASGTERHLAMARTHLSANALDDSAHEYEQLVRDPGLAGDLIEELEEAVEAHPKHATLQRVLGDAYMRAGQLQNALEAYRHALAKL
jgi:hypothetical protein